MDRTIFIESDVEINLEEFKNTVIQILNSPTGWGRIFNWIITQDYHAADNVLTLSTNDDIMREYGDKFNMLSVAEVGGKFTHINYTRWKNGSVESRLTLSKYRTYVINHEVGHLLGLHHPDLTEIKTDICPNMAVQTDGMCDESYKENVEPTEYEIDFVRKRYESPSIFDIAISKMDIFQLLIMMIGIIIYIFFTDIVKNRKLNDIQIENDRL